MLFSIAYTRGLFTDSLEDILGRAPPVSGVTITGVDPNVNKEPVFLGDWCMQRTESSKPLFASTWNKRLQGICIDSGLIGRFTSYVLVVLAPTVRLR
jgi:hypothetical protein